MKITNEYQGITCIYHDVSDEAVSSALSNISSKFATYCKLRCKGAGKEWQEKIKFVFSLEDTLAVENVKSSIQIDFTENKFNISVLKTDVKTLDPRDIAVFLFSMWLSNQILSLKECLYSQTPLCEEDPLDIDVCGGVK